ncbi:MAG: hypothetical protein J5840_05615, partial [Lachnospiraceae bacterium]|nr:hypothetical protein [Lachnospiraceae bacterium]
MSRKITAFVTAALLMLTSLVLFVPMNVKAAPEQKTYTFSDLKSTMEYGLTSKVNSDGELEISFEDQYKSQFYEIPSDINPDSITKVEFEVKSKNTS